MFSKVTLNQTFIFYPQPVYTDSTEKISFDSHLRSLSCPELTMYRKEIPRISRKRTYSDNYGQQIDSSRMGSTMTLNRVQSDGDVSRIDKAKTFKAFDGSNLIQTKDLLSNIMTALGSMQLTNEDELSDSQIWTSERRGSRQSFTPSDDSCKNRPARQRAYSDFYLPHRDSFKNSNEFTWNGNNDDQVEEYLRHKTRKFSIASVFQSKSESIHRSETNNQNTLHVPGEGRSRSFISKINPFKARVQGQEGKRHSVSSADPQLYLKNTAKGRESRFSLSQSATENMELLEKTTIADLIRAIEEVQTKSNISAETPLLSDFGGRKTKTSTVASNLQVHPNGSRRGSLRPVPAYTTSQNTGRLNTSSVLDRELAASSSMLNPVNSLHVTTPKSTKRSVPKASHNSPPPQILRRTFSLRPSPLATLSHSTANAPALSETPTITVQAPDVTKRNVLWPPESIITDRSVHELKDRSKHKRSDSK